jgi:hypothetical protein
VGNSAEVVMILRMLRGHRPFITLISTGLFLSLSWPVSAADEGFHLVTWIQGNVQVQRQGQKKHQVFFGYRLKTADKLLLNSAGKVTVLCQNLRSVTLSQTGNVEVAKVCQVAGRSVLQPINQDRIDTRPLMDLMVPYIISPRDTAVIEAQPLLRWNPVPGSKNYRVAVTGPEVNWETTVSETQVKYGGSSMPLKPGIRYRVTITAENGESSQKNGVTGFSRLENELAQQVQTDIATVQQQDLSEEVKVLTIAHLESSNKLYAAAIDRLTQWIGQGNRSAAAQYLLGDLYFKVDLPQLAREPYVEGLALMRQNKNLAGEAAILNNLGDVDQSLGKLRDAISWLEEAQKIYRELENGERVQAIENQLADLKRRI